MGAGKLDSVELDAVEDDVVEEDEEDAEEEESEEAASKYGEGAKDIMLATPLGELSQT